MVRQFKQITITIHKDQLKKFKVYCQQVKLPLSRFLALAAEEKLRRWLNETQKGFVSSSNTPHTLEETSKGGVE